VISTKVSSAPPFQFCVLAMPLSEHFLLSIYVASETIRALLVFAAIRAQTQISYVLIALLSELAKLSVALSVLAWSNSFKVSEIRTTLFFSTEWKIYIAIAVPSALYLVNNLLYMFALQVTTPAFVHMAMLGKLPITALLHHILIRSQRSMYSWVSLGFLTIGILLFHLPSEFLAIVNGTRAPKDEEIDYAAFLTPCIGFSIAIISGFNSIYTEIILREKIPFWVTQTWLYTFGVLAAGATFSFWPGSNDSSSAIFKHTSSAPSELHRIAIYISVVAAVAGSGLIVANILRTRDNLVKIVGTSASIIAITLSQTVFLRTEEIMMQTTAGVGIATISTWTYHYFKQAPEYEQPPSKEGDSEAQQSQPEEKKTIIVPTRRKVLLSCAVVGVLTLLTPYISQTRIEIPTHEVVDEIPTHVLTPAHPTSTHIIPPSHPYSKDLMRFFVPHGRSPAEWAPGVNPPRCVWNYLEAHNITCDSHEVLHWEKAYLETGCPVFPIPDQGLIFHTYWRGPWSDFLEWPLEAFLATQRLGDGHHMILWYEGSDGPPQSTLNWLQPYARYVEIRKIDLAQESKGTCLEHKPEWTGENFIGIAAFSDLVRVLLLAKYGGVWMDTDIIMLRDMTPLFRMGPTTVGLPDGSPSGRFNNAIEVFGPVVAGGIGEKVLNLVCRIPHNENTWHKEWDAQGPKKWPGGLLYNEGLFSICEDNENCGFGLLPATWTDGMSFREKGRDAVYACDPQGNFGHGGIPTQFRGLFAWHTRLDHTNECLTEEHKTLGAKLRMVMRAMIEEGLALEGRDVIPPALWLDS